MGRSNKIMLSLLTCCKAKATIRMQSPNLNFPDQLGMLAEDLKILILLCFNNFLGWYIQVKERFVRIVIHLQEGVNVTEVQADGVR